MFGESAGLQLGMDEFAVDTHLESAVFRRDEYEARNPVLEMWENGGRQTDGFGFVVSDRTIDEFQLHLVPPKSI